MPTMTYTDAPDDSIPSAPGPLDIKFECFGFELEYALRPKAPTDMTLTVFAGGAAGHYVRDDNHDQHGKPTLCSCWNRQWVWNSGLPIGFI
jgi:hypothetical protein